MGWLFEPKKSQPVVSPDQEIAYFGLGCFWGAEKLFWEIDGVASTAVGYAVAVVFDPATVSFEQLLATALEAHDPTQGNRQGNDIGTQYRSAVYTTTDQQLATAKELISRYETRLKEAGFGAITTEVLPLAETPAQEFYLAEDEHQKYLLKNPYGYCPHHATGVSCS